VGWILQDFKTTSSWSMKNAADNESWRAQLNCYAEMLRRHSFEIAGLEIIAICRDWSKNEARRSPDYPQSQVAVVKIPLWTSEETVAYIRERVRMHQMARESLPFCTQEERWQKPDTYALIKKGAKRATKVYDNLPAALEAEKPGYLIEERPGKPTRCLSYCNVLAFCEQGQAYVKDGEEVVADEG
jgi:hypothetical protein